MLSTDLHILHFYICIYILYVFIFDWFVFNFLDGFACASWAIILLFAYGMGTHEIDGFDLWVNYPVNAQWSRSNGLWLYYSFIIIIMPFLSSLGRDRSSSEIHDSTGAGYVTRSLTVLYPTYFPLPECIWSPSESCWLLQGTCTTTASPGGHCCGSWVS